MRGLEALRQAARRVERTAEASGTATAALVRERARLIATRRIVPFPPSPLPDKLYSVIDGTGVPMTSNCADTGDCLINPLQPQAS